MSLKELRKKKEFTQKFVAEKIGMDRTEYVRLESGKRGIELKQAKQLADTLGVKLDDLIKHL